MESRKKFLRNRGGLLKHNATTSNNQTTQPQQLANPFAQQNTNNPFAANANLQPLANQNPNTGQFNPTPNQAPLRANQGMLNQNPLGGATAQNQGTQNRFVNPPAQQNLGSGIKSGSINSGNVMNMFNFTEEELMSLNCSEELIRFTTGKMPPLQRVKNIQMPIGCHIRPFYNTGEEVPCINFFDMYKKKQMQEPDKKFDLPRCAECRAFVNPFFKFMSGGTQMQCNLCGLVQAVPNFYASKLDSNGYREDIMDR